MKKTTITPGRTMWRSRWAAIGAAVAVAVGGGGVFMASAASSAESSVVMITPARILDTRTDLGLVGPFVSVDPMDLQVTGLINAKSGADAPAPATVVPEGATGVLLNVTAVNPGADGFISVRPADAPGAPSTSNLNFSAGDIVPNAVTVALPTAGVDAGKIEITYDAFGVVGPSTEVLIDVVGYSVDAGVEQIRADVAALSTQVDGHANSAAAFSSSDGETSLLFGGDRVIESVTLVAPADGTVIVNSSGYVRHDGVLESTTIARCSIDTSKSVVNSHAQIATISNAVRSHQMAATRGFDVVAGEELTVNLVCNKGNAAGVLFADPSITAMFAPS